MKAREILASEEHFLPLPDQFEINEYRIMERFAWTLTTSRSASGCTVSSKEAVPSGRFKNAIHSMGIQNDWYHFKQATLEELAIEWLKELNLPFDRDETQDETTGPTM